MRRFYEIMLLTQNSTKQSAFDKNKMKKYTQLVLLILLSIFPLFMISVRGWSSAILIITFIVSLMHLVTRRLNPAGQQNIAIEVRDELKRIAIVFALPFLAVATAQYVQGELHLEQFDAPLRLILVIPIIFIIETQTIQFGKIKLESCFEISLPISVFIIFVFTFFDKSSEYNTTRLTNSIVDPLSFGSTTLLLGVLSLASINFSTNKYDYVINFFKLLGFAMGVYLSIKSGSRTGWLALPFVLPICIWGLLPLSFRKEITIGKIFFLIFLLLLTSIMTLYGSSTIYKRWVEAYQELHQYWISTQSKTLAPDASTAYRVTFFRIAYDILSHNFWSGIPDNQLISWLELDRIKKFASPAAIAELIKLGFHNQIASSISRFGIWGLISTLALFIYPIKFFTSMMLKVGSKTNEKTGDFVIFSKLGLCYSIFIPINTFTFHMLDYKYIMSFHAMMLAVLMGTTLRLSKFRNF